jgi:hypothetical protein
MQNGAVALYQQSCLEISPTVTFNVCDYTVSKQTIIRYSAWIQF